MYHSADSTMFSNSETSARNFHAIPHATVTAPLSSHGQSPFPFHSLETPKSGFIPPTGSSPETPSHTITGYNYPHRSDDQLPWSFSMARNLYDARPTRPLEKNSDLTFTPTIFINDPRTRVAQVFPRIRTVEVVFTDDARRKLSEGVHRWCFNCRATETNTWRRSSLSPGRLLCNRCGLFERSHGAPRPEKFPRRRRARPNSVLPTPAFIGEQWPWQNHLPSTVLPTQSFRPLDAADGQSIPQSLSWMTQAQDEASPSPSPVTGSQCYSTSHWHQQTMYRRDGQM